MPADIEGDIAWIKENMPTKRWWLALLLTQTFAIIGGVAGLLKFIR